MKSSHKCFGQEPSLHETLGDDYFCYHDVPQTASPLQPLSLLALSHLRLLAAQGPETTLKPFPQLWGGHLSVTFLRLVPRLSFTSIYIYLLSSFQNTLALLQALSLDFCSLSQGILSQAPNGHSPTVSQNPQRSSRPFLFLLSSVLFSSSLLSLHLEIRIQFPAACEVSPSNTALVSKRQIWRLPSR